MGRASSGGADLSIAYSGRVADGMQIGPGYDGRDTIRRWAGMGPSTIARAALVTVSTVQRWEAGHGGVELLQGYNRAPRKADAEAAVLRLADVYAALMWIGGGCRWPSVLEDDALRAAVARMRSAELPEPRP